MVSPNEADLDLREIVSPVPQIPYVTGLNTRFNLAEAVPRYALADQIRKSNPPGETAISNWRLVRLLQESEAGDCHVPAQRMGNGNLDCRNP